MLTDAQRRALVLASKRPTRVVMPGLKIGRLEIGYAVAHLLLLADPKLLKTVAATDGEDRDPGTAAVVVITQAGVTHLSEPVPHVSQLLTYSARPRGSEHGYTDEPSRAMRDEPEAMDAPDMQTVHATHRARQFNQYREARRALVDAITVLQNGPGADDVRVARELRHMRARIDRLDKLFHGKAA